jgi:hypothetical protein
MKGAIATGLLLLTVSAASADPLTCTLAGYKGLPGLSAAVADNALTLTWDGDRGQELRMRFTLVSGAPTIQELAVRKNGGPWGVLASNAAADFHVVAGLRRMSNQQMTPLRGLGVELTNEIVDRFRWEPFWDAPLELSEPAAGRGGNPPPVAGVANQPGLPRKSEEITRAAASFRVTTCDCQDQRLAP